MTDEEKAAAKDAYAKRMHEAIAKLTEQMPHFARKSFRILSTLTSISEEQSSVAFRPFWEDYRAKVEKMVDTLANVSPVHIEKRMGIRYSLQSGFIVGWIQEMEGKIHAGLYLELSPYSVIV